MVNTRSRKGKEKASSSRAPRVEEPRIEDSPVPDSSPAEMDEVEEEIVGDYDSRFESAKVEAFWRQLIHHAVHMEKSLLPTNESIGPILDAHDWRPFVDTLPTINLTWVQEFYASASFSAEESLKKGERRKQFAVVRGTTVSFTRRDIQATLRLPDQPPCAYSDMYNPHRRFSLVDMAQVTRVIAVEGTEWVGPHIRRTCLTPDAKYWYEFIRHWLLPTMHTTDVIRARGILVYAIMTRVHIDVVSLISTSLMDNIRAIGSEIARSQVTKKSPLLYPTLIHLLCERAGVRRYRGDIEREPADALSWEAKELGAAPKRARTTSTGGESSSARPVSLASLQQSVEQMRIDQLGIRDEMRELRDRVVHQERTMGPYLGQYMREMMLYSDRVRGLAAIDYPYPPAFPTYTPSREDAAAGRHDADEGGAAEDAADMDHDAE